MMKTPSDQNGKANHPLYYFPYPQPIIIAFIAFWQPLPKQRLQNTIPGGPQTGIIAVLYDSLTITQLNWLL